MGIASIFTIHVGRVYIYLSGIPPRCAGHRYRVHRFVKDVPVYTEKVLVECLTGPDAGVWFTCSPANFALRYKLEDVSAVVQPESQGAAPCQMP